jgi:hypothetical protein
MKKMTTVILILLLGCAAKTNGDIGFSTIARDDNAPGIAYRLNEVVTDPISFERLWADIYDGMDPIPDMPKIDFAEDMVIAVSPGRMLTGGYDAEIVAVQEKENKISVTILLTKPSGTVTEALTQPHHIIKLKKSTAPIIYKWVER